MPLPGWDTVWSESWTIGLQHPGPVSSHPGYLLVMMNTRISDVLFHHRNRYLVISNEGLCLHSGTIRCTPNAPSMNITPPPWTTCWRRLRGVTKLCPSLQMHLEYVSTQLPFQGTVWALRCMCEYVEPYRSVTHLFFSSFHLAWACRRSFYFCSCYRYLSSSHHRLNGSRLFRSFFREITLYAPRVHHQLHILSNFGNKKFFWARWWIA